MAEPCLASEKCLTAKGNYFEGSHISVDVETFVLGEETDLEED